MINIEEGISIICSTNRTNNLTNILDNFINQNHNIKELIIIVNLDINNINYLFDLIRSFENVQLFLLGSKYTLGECLNFAIERAKYPIIAKFDDDDYYGPNYLKDSVKYLSLKDVAIVGKSSIWVYFVQEKLIGIKGNNKENMYVNRVAGSTIIFKKELSKEIKFESINLGEDVNFCKDCINAGYKIYSTNKSHYVYIRNKSISHTWQIGNQYILRQCSNLTKVDNLQEFIYNSVNKS